MMKKFFYLVLSVAVLAACHKDDDKAPYGDVFTEKVEGVELRMVYVKGGTFRMGATEEQGEDDPWEAEYPVHQVTLSNYYMAAYPVTQGLWEAVMGENPSNFKYGDNYPVESVSWDDAQEFIVKLNKLTGKTYALPTEAQWEYAARGGEKSKGYKYSGSNDIDEVAWYDDNSNGSTHTVGEKKPNELGIYDMSGNVYEWCRDWGDGYSDKAQVDPVGPEDGPGRGIRGGSCYDDTGSCRVSYRINYDLGNRSSNIGFRLVLVP